MPLVSEIKPVEKLNLKRSKKALSLALAAIIAGSSILTSCGKEEAESVLPESSLNEELSTGNLAIDATSTGVDVRVDFGGSTAPTNYNLGSMGVSTPVALKDFNKGTVTAVKLATVAAFKGVYTNSNTYPSTLGIPQTAAADLFYGSVTTAAIELSGLTATSNYNLSFFASRMNFSGSLETQYKIIGATTQTVLIEPANNTTKIASINAVKPNASGKIRIEVSKGAKNTTSPNFWLNTLIVQETIETIVTPPTTPTTPPSTPTTPTTPSISYNYLVKTASELKTAISKAKSGEVIYVDDNAQIDLTGQGTVKIPAGVTLMSGRGNNAILGGMIYTTNVSHGIMLQAGGAGVKVIGLRVRGASTSTDRSSSTYCRGIYSTFSNLEVANCEVFGWNHAGVYLSGGATNVKIHDSYFHHNQQSGLGYGISIAQAFAVINNNYFDYNRHAIAGSGIAGSGYEAAYNVVMPNATEHSFDMHGDGGDGAQYTAGDYVNVHDNTFYMKAYKAITVRGTPKNGTTIQNNKFIHTSQSAALNLYATNNTISGNTYSIGMATINPGPSTSL
ncbi:right-handed parallel beta-helix repeat-containing protein [Solitalea sp. MAHUQ-68]|uniref:Right-handed parallel beta-helix repeat-containing protein n=1 Tax=Solitalea agri TaxID=2953739 RepID=A0A9X2JCH8_9SPHI|nr:right-handed parallel beta-helix repeat-containing protein [Solitalea agri]MCO4292554.1 right-handed parallel beta-helix repeat-containing protein [Solitalea agri]